MSRGSPSLVLQPRPSDDPELLGYAADMGFGIETIDTAIPRFIDGDWRRYARSLHRALAPFGGRVWCHGAYYDLYVNSPDPWIRDASERRIRQGVEMAEILCANGVVFHTNHLPCTTSPSYIEQWVEASVEFWNGVVAAADVPVLLENMWDADPGPLARVLDEVDGLQACFDVGHANVFSDVPVAEWLARLGERVTYLHISDNHGSADDGLPPGDGGIDWVAFDGLVRTHCPGASAMLGVGSAPRADIERAVAFLWERGIHPAPAFPAAGAS